MVERLQGLGRHGDDPVELGDQGIVERFGRADPALVDCRCVDRVDELRRIQDLDRESSTDLHLLRILRVERRIRSQPGRRGPVAHRIRTVFVEHRCRRDDVALRLRHLLAVGVHNEARDCRVGPRHFAVLEFGPQHRREQPGADDVLALAAQRVGEDELP